MRFSAARGYSLLFFLSGATGLVYELLWVRLLYQAFGSTLESVTTVVAAYMGGLGLGAWLLGRRGDRHPRPAALYGRLEIAIGVFGLVSPFGRASGPRRRSTSASERWRSRWRARSTPFRSPCSPMGLWRRARRLVARCAGWGSGCSA